MTEYKVTIKASPHTCKDPDIQQQGASIFSSIFVLCATTLGAGILALPYAISITGYILGPLLLVISAMTTYYTITLLLLSAELSNTNSYEELAYYCYQKKGQILVNIISLLLIFGCLVAFQVIIGDTLSASLSNLVSIDSEYSWILSRAVLVPLITITLILPLTLLRSVHQLEKFAMLAVILIIGFSIWMIIECIISVGKRQDSTMYNPFASNYTSVFQAFPIFLLAYTCQTMIFPVFNGLTNKSVSSMNKVTFSSIFLCSFLYLSVGLSGYFTYTTIDGDILNTLGTDVSFNIIRLCFTIAIIIHYPIVGFAFKNGFIVLLRNFNYEISNNVKYNWIQSVSLITVSTILSIVLPSLSSVFSLTGSLCSFPYCFIFPSVFYLKTQLKNNILISYPKYLFLLSIAILATICAGISIGMNIQQLV